MKRHYAKTETPEIIYKSVCGVIDKKNDYLTGIASEVDCPACKKMMK